MDEREYFGIMSSPFTTEREKERVRNKIEKRYEQERRGVPKEIKVYHRFVDQEKFRHIMPVEGFISMGFEGGDVSLFVEDEFEKKSTYKDIKKYIKNIEKKYNDTAVLAEEKMRLFHPNKIEEMFGVKAPNWMEHLSGPCYSKAKISKEGITKVHLSYPYGVSLWVDNSGAKLTIKKFAIGDVLSAIAVSEGLIYMPETYQSLSGSTYGYYVFKEFEHEGKYRLNRINSLRKKFRTNKVSNSGFYRITNETEKSIWVEPTAFNVNKYLEGFADFMERSKHPGFNNMIDKYELYLPVMSKIKRSDELEKELDNLEKIDVSAEKTGKGIKL